MSIKSKSKSKKSCPKGEILRVPYTRKAYTRSDGTKVEASKVPATCVKDTGKPGKGPKTLPPVGNEIHLSSYGYAIHKPTAARRAALRAASNENDTLWILRRLNSLRNRQGVPANKKIFSDDVEYMQDLYAKVKGHEKPGKRHPSKSGKTGGGVGTNGDYNDDYSLGKDVNVDDVNAMNNSTYPNGSYNDNLTSEDAFTSKTPGYENYDAPDETGFSGGIGFSGGADIDWATSDDEDYNDEATSDDETNGQYGGAENEATSDDASYNVEYIEVGSTKSKSNSYLKEEHVVDGKRIVFETLSEPDANQILKLDLLYLDSDRTIEDVLKDLHTFSGEIIGIKAEDRLQGYAIFVPKDHSEVKIKWFCANKGYGTALYSFLESYLRSNDYTKIDIIVSLEGSYGLTRLNFWYKNGYMATTIVLDEKKILMEKEI